MFEITENGPLRIDIDVSGKIDSDEMKMALEKLIEKSSVIRNGNMLYTITD
jgi:hypothetical protein